jgi:hypothetical protein
MKHLQSFNEMLMGAENPAFAELQQELIQQHQQQK